ncbi:MAG: helix-turn-helix domain-containing protein [Pseudoclavibacter sp.]
MRERGITQADFAAAIDRQQSYVSERVRGLYPLSTDELDGLASLLDMTGRQLLALLADRMKPMSEAPSNVSTMRPRPDLHSLDLRGDQDIAATYDRSLIDPDERQP